MIFITTEQELIQQHFRQGDEFMTVTEICGYLRESTGVPINENNISREMKKLGYKKERKRVAGSPSALSGFYVKKVHTTIEELQAKIANSRGGNAPGASAESMKAKLFDLKGRDS